MKSFKNIFIILMLFTTILTAGCSRVSVHVQKAEFTKKPFVYEEEIKMEASQTIPIIPIVSGKIISGKPDIGQKVKAGDILFKLDTSKYEEELSSLSKKSVNNEVSEEDDPAALSLVNQGIITKAEYNKLMQKKGIKHPNNAVNEIQSQAKLNTIAKIIEECTVKSPIDGVISELFIGENQSVMSGKPALVVSQNAYVCGEISLPENIGDALEESGKLNKLKVQLIDGENTIDGEFKVNKAENGHKTYKVEFKNKDNKLKVGKKYKVHIETEREIPCIVLPAKALIGEDTVAIVTESGLADMKTVKVAYNDNKNIFVIDGINEGEEVIVNPPKNLEIGVQVNEV